MPTMQRGTQTPRKKGKTDELNAHILLLDEKWRLNLGTRDETWSPGLPSRRGSKTARDRIFSSIKFLWHKNRNTLSTIEQRFNHNVDYLPSTEDKLDFLLNLLRKELPKGALGEEQSRNTERASINHVLGTSSPPSTGRSGRKVRKCNLNRNSLEAVVRPGTPTEEDTDSEAPDSPSLRATQIRSQVNLSQPHRRGYNLLEDGAYDSTPPSNYPSFASTVQRSGVTTANTSFRSDVWTKVDEPQPQIQVDYPELPLSSFSASTQDALLAATERFDSTTSDPSAVSQRNLSTSPRQRLVAGPQALSLSPSTPRKSSKVVDIRIASLSKAGLFMNENHGDGVPEFLKNAPFIFLWECSRVALHNKTKIAALDIPADITSLQMADFGFYKDVLWPHLIAKQLKLPQGLHLAAWNAPQYARMGYNLKGTVHLDGSPLFRMTLDDLHPDKTCRFQRKFGADRFLYLRMPQHLPKNKDLARQELHFRAKIREWLMKEHSFCGRKWRAFAIESDRKKGDRDETLVHSFRIVLFAISGVGISPEGSVVFRNGREHHGRGSMDIEALINWFIPLKINAHQKFCKAFARVELGLSRAFPGLVFKRSQIRPVPDIVANGDAEDGEFDDPALTWKYPDVALGTVMNDGCARISVGAMKIYWKKTKNAGPVPSAIQGRIRGAKGMWLISAPPSTQEPDHLKIWIEISGSQLKFEPHEDDQDPERLTLDIVWHSSKPSTTQLNIAFFPILENRGVPKEQLKKLVTEVLDSEREHLLKAMEDPQQLQKFLHDTQKRKEEDNQSKSMQWKAGLPWGNAEKAALLLEAEFKPKECAFLAKTILKIVEDHLARVTEKLAVPIGKSVNVKGVVDPYGILKPGEIHMRFSSDIEDERTGETSIFLADQSLLVARHPALRNSDIQRVKAVYRQELDHIRDVVVFSRRGQYPLAGKLQGGDYDGDSFWLCWEQEIVQSFKNAPPPMHNLDPKAYGIQVDSRTVESVLTGPNPFDNFLENSFAFRCATDVLGRVTRVHEKLCYKENSISSPSIDYFSALHDLLVDSAKNGYRFDDNDLDKAIQRQCGREPPPTAYMQDIKNSKAKSTDDDDNFGISKSSIKHNPHNITDFIYFEIIKPHVMKTISKLKKVLPGTRFQDADLERFFKREYSQAKSSQDQDILDELDKLLEQIDKVRRKWFVGSRQKGMENFKALLLTCHKEYQAIRPSGYDQPTTHTTHPILRRWISQLKDAENPDMPSTGTWPDWNLLKASLLISKRYLSHTFCFNMAGRELAYLKSHAVAARTGIPFTLRYLADAMYAHMKPKRIKRKREADDLGVLQLAEAGNDDVQFTDWDSDGDEDSWHSAMEEAETFCSDTDE